jgi:hypothetical protein
MQCSDTVNFGRHNTVEHCLCDKDFNKDYYARRAAAQQQQEKPTGSRTERLRGLFEVPNAATTLYHRLQIRSASPALGYRHHCQRYTR